MRLLYKVCLTICVVLIIFDVTCEAAKKRKKIKTKSMILRKKETNAIDFIRLTVMRMIFGIATRFGLGEQISEALNGAFVPPGVDTDDYDYNASGGFNLFDRGGGGGGGGEEDDYDY